MLEMDTGQIVIENTILAAVELWLGTAVNQGKVVKMLNEKFKPDEAKDALESLKEAGLIENVQRHNHGEKFFEDLVKDTATLSSEGKLPKITVVSKNIFRIPKPDLDGLDKVVVGARMEVMEKKMESMDNNVNQLLENFKTMINQKFSVENFPATLPVTVTQPRAAGPDGKAGGYAQAAAAGVATAPTNRPKGKFRSRLDSKRKLEETDIDEITVNPNETGNGQQDPHGQWNDARRKTRKINYGKAKVTTGKSDMAVAPLKFLLLTPILNPPKSSLKRFLLTVQLLTRQEMALWKLLLSSV